MKNEGGVRLNVTSHNVLLFINNLVEKISLTKFDENSLDKNKNLKQNHVT